MIEAERRTDRQHPFADLEVVGLAELDGRQVLALDLEQRHIAARIGADQLGLQLAAVGQADDDLVGVGHHVVVGQHVAIRGNDEARAQRLRLALATTTRTALPRRHAALEKLTEDRRQPFQVGHLRAGDTLGHLLPGADVHHRRRRLFDQGGEVRQLSIGNQSLTEQYQPGHYRHTRFQSHDRHTTPRHF
ncbi:hypothetical protein FQZ97_555060 [compost metagenome]